MDTMLRSIADIIESNLPWDDNNNNLQNRLSRSYPNCGNTPFRIFEAIKYVTGKRTSNHTDYEVIKLDDHYGKESVAIKGELGFIRVTLTPLFELLEASK